MKFLDNFSLYSINFGITSAISLQVNDINATDTSFADETIVTGDDFGMVKLFRFPCIKKGKFEYKHTYCVWI